MNLPNKEDIDKLDKSNRRRGFRKTIFLQLQSALIPLLALIIYGIITHKKISDLEQNINQINQKIIQKNTVVITSNGTPTNFEMDNLISENTLGDKTGFYEDGWIIKYFDIDEDGFYCPSVKGFDYWNIWTVKKYPPDVKKISVKILTKPANKSKEPPTIVIAYGDYKESYSPSIFYRMNIFDTDNTTIRLYDYDDNSVKQAWLSKEPDISSELLIELSPRYESLNSRRLVINPYMQYVVKDELDPIEYTPTEDFATLLPTTGIKEDSVYKQIGVGSTINTCFRPILITIDE